MFSPVKAIAAGALVFALGGMLLITQPFDQQAGVPGAEPGGDQTSDGEANASITLKMVEELEEREWDWDRSPEGHAEIGNMGVVALVEASDPRLSGTWADVATCRATPAFNVCIGSVRVENEDGVWLGRRESVHVERLPVGDGYQILNVGWTVLEGQDGYAGLTAIVTYDEEKMAALPDIDGMGLIVDFGRPPQPDLPSE